MAEFFTELWREYQTMSVGALVGVWFGLFILSGISMALLRVPSLFMGLLTVLGAAVTLLLLVNVVLVVGTMFLLNAALGVLFGILSLVICVILVKIAI